MQTVEISWLPANASTYMRHGKWNSSVKEHPTGQGEGPCQLQGCGSQSAKPELDAKLVHTSNLNKQKIARSRINEQTFEFVNSTKPFFNKNPAVRKQVRAYVMKDFMAKKKRRKELHQRCYAKATTSTSNVDYEEQPDSAMDTIEKAYSLKQSPLQGYGVLPGHLPIKMQPRIQNSLVRYLTGIPGAIYPFDSPSTVSQLRKEWFHYAMSDEVLFHALLYTATVTVGLMDGVAESGDSISQLDRALHAVNSALTGVQGKFSNGIIGALSCVALAEALRGQFANWKLHMKGLERMVHIRGGFSALDRTLQMKLLRSDIHGAVEYAVSPHFRFQNFGPLSIYSSSYVSGLDIVDNTLILNLTSSGLHPRFVAVFKDLHYFSHTVAGKLETYRMPSELRIFIEDSYLLQYRLLWPSNTEFRSQEDSAIEEACRMGALLYIRGIFHEFPYSSQGSKCLVKRLRESLLKVSGHARSASLFLWLLFMGRLSSKDGSERAWFNAHLVKAAATLGIKTWKQAKTLLEGLLWIERIHEKPCRNIWEEIEIMRTILCSGGA